MHTRCGHFGHRAVACREDALKRSEDMLEADAVKFDLFLRDNEAAVNEAIRAADAEGKRRSEKQVEIKRLNGRIAVARSELGKQARAIGFVRCSVRARFAADVTGTSMHVRHARRSRLKQELTNGQPTSVSHVHLPGSTSLSTRNPDKSTYAALRRKSAWQSVTASVRSLTQ